MRRNIRAAGIAICLTLGATLSAAGATLPDATYRCEMYSGNMLMHLGDIEVVGNTYRGPASDGDYGPAYKYKLTDAGTISWGGPMGGFDSGGNTIVSSVVKSGGDNLAFDIMMQLQSGNFSTLSCSS